MVNSYMIKHLGIIMDGNRRWAKARGLPTLEGHRRGYDKLKEVGEWCLNQGIEVLTVYAFSIENWKRTQEEVSYLMDLIHRAVTVEIDEFMKRDIRVRVIGRRDGLSEKMRLAVDQVWERTHNNRRGLLQLAINYGGHAEIVDAVRKICLSGTRAEEINEKIIEANLYAPDVPPPDLIIRTSGEQRLSGFLIWESAYSEFYFTQTHWPDFSENDLQAALDWYEGRERRYGV